MSPSGAFIARPSEQPLASRNTTQAAVPVFCARAPVVAVRVNDATLLLTSEVT